MPPSAVVRFLEEDGRRPLDAYEERFGRVIRLVSRIRPVGPGTRILEVGIGTGWFPVLCAANGLECVGLEIRPELIERAQERAKQYGVKPELRLGSVEDADLEPNAFDVVLADAVFEHVENWERGLANVASCLRPGGVLVFGSTNRFALLSGEFYLPFYGWLPNRVRYWLRRILENPDVMVCGIDFHQFTYGGVRRALREGGFSRVYDIAEILDPQRLNHPAWWKVALLRAMRQSTVIKHALLTFWPTTELMAVK
jgi:SAM-dependent methyltransferase